MKKVLVLVPFPMSDTNRTLRSAQVDAVNLGPDIQFEYRSVRAAPRNYISASDLALADIGMLEAGLEAEAEGYDAVCIDTVSDSGVAALRSELSIPVIGPGRTAILTAMMLGNRFSIVTMWEHWRHLYQRTLNELGLAHACASIRSLDIAPDNQALMTGKEEQIFPALNEMAQSCISKDRAEVIILGSTTMHQSHAYLQERLSVPVINPGPLSYKIAETLLGLGLTHSRKAYPVTHVRRHELLHAMFECAADFKH
ncbi:aspartate/glutamate racemase family protein [Roseibium sp.]|jgi:allantoin racemase|uniref:aspartate/glutamate racemase family protein n=1 Tax=Roseibium sp. TaxID=1936156 RepID=UPI003BA96870